MRRALALHDPPLGLHLLDAPLLDGNTEDSLPPFNDGSGERAEAFSIPVRKHSLALLGGHARRPAQLQRISIAEADFALALCCRYSEAIAASEVVVTLAGKHLAPGLTRLSFKCGLLSANPAQLADDGNAHGLIRDGQGHSDSHSTVRRIDAEVKVLDPLAHDRDPKAADG